MNDELRAVTDKIWNAGAKLTHNQLDEILSELVEAAEKAKVEEVIEAVENFDAGCNEEYAYAASYIADDLREKFLTNPER